jgi:hypothetical protein
MVASGLPEVAMKVESSGGRRMSSCIIGMGRRDNGLMHIQCSNVGSRRRALDLLNI